MGFKFGASRTGGPEHALDTESGRKQIAENGRPRGIRREVRIEIGRLPVRDTGKNDALHVAKNLVEGFALRRSLGWQLGANFPWLRARQHREFFNARMIIGDPVHDSVALAAELLWRHVK